MKIKCVSFYNTITQQYDKSSEMLILNKEYVVLEINCEIGRDTFYRIIPEDSSDNPTLFEAQQLVITSHNIPSNWSIGQIDNLIILGPTLWLEPGFWEDFFEYEDKAIQIYKREALIIYKEEMLERSG